MQITAFENCTCFNLRRAARTVTQLYDEALKPSGLRATQLSLMAVLNGIGPVAMTRLANAMAMDRTTLTRNLKPLIAQGLISTMEGTDKRQRQVDLTDDGRRRLTDAEPLWRQAQTDLAKKLGVGEWTSLVKGLGDVVAETQDG